MSRIGKMPVAVPQGVDVQIKEDQISVKGTGGMLSLTQHAQRKAEARAPKTFVQCRECLHITTLRPRERHRFDVLRKASALILCCIHGG